MLPPIRYPLPTLIGVLLLSLLTWQGAAWSKVWRARVAAQVELALAGPPVPKSKTPQVVAGPIIRRALLLRDETVATDRPNGSVVETIDRRMFLDVYDTWPEPGPTTHVRVGNRKAMGWVKSSEVLLWNTRLVIRPPGGRLTLSGSPTGADREIQEVESLTLPVIGASGAWVEVVVWDPKAPWSKILRTGWVLIDSLPPEAWGVWISQVELPILLRQAMEGEPSLVRLRAVLGRLSDKRAITLADVELARKTFPSLVFDLSSDPKVALDRLAEANAHPEAEASWSGLSFRFLPLSDLP